MGEYAGIPQLRTEATGETQSFMKVLVGASDDRIRSLAMIGSKAGALFENVPRRA